MNTFHIYYLIVVLATISPRAHAVEPASDLRSVLPQPEFYIKHKDALGLTAAQGSELRAAFEAMNRDFRAAEAEMTLRAGELQTAIEDATQSVDAVTQRLDALLAAENRCKSLRFRASLAAHRLLTPEQRELARTLTNPTPTRSRAGPAANLTDATREELQEKLDRLRVLALEVFPEGPPPEIRRRSNELLNKVRNGRTEEANQLFDEMIADLAKQRATNQTPKP